MGHSTDGQGVPEEPMLNEAKVAAAVVAPLVNSARFYRYFNEWEQHGFHVTPVHFYSPIPEVRSLRDDVWGMPSEAPGLDFNDVTQLDLLTNVFSKFREECKDFPLKSTGRPEEFFFDNGRFEGADALVLYCMVRHLRPQLVMEIGSGYSTRLSLAATQANGVGRVLCVEPYPDDANDPLRASLLRSGAPGLDLIEDRVENLDMGLFRGLSANDVLFIDSSHVAKIGSDVNFLFFEVMPRLAPGVVVHVHDVFLPDEYPRSWVTEHHLFWNEAYLLRAFLTFNSEFEVLVANHYLHQKYPEKLREAFPDAPSWIGGSFWMRRVPSSY